MTGAIIAGGAGTRLRPLTNTRPKPMMPLAGKPLVAYQVELMARHGAGDVVLCTGIGAASVRDYFGDRPFLGSQVKYSVEDTPLGTAGAVRLAEPLFCEDTVVVTNGDNLIDFDLSALLQFHLSNGADATIGLMTVPYPTACGVVRTDDGCRVTAFEEPSEETKRQIASGIVKPNGIVTVNAGVYILEREVLRRIEYGANCSIEREFFPSLVRDGLKVLGYPLSGYILDIGTPQAYLKAHRDLLSGSVRAEVAGNTRPGGDVRIHSSATIAPGCHIGPGCWVAAGAVIEGFSAIGPGCEIGEGSVIRGSVVLENVKIGAGCRLEGCILDRDSSLGDGAALGAGSVIAAGTVLPGVEAENDYQKQSAA